MPHVAATYAAINALLCLGTKEAFDCINRRRLYSFLISCKDRSSGGFRMHDDGEVDIRASYCALSIASLCNVMTPELCDGVPRYVRSCQTHEGGMGGEPFNEAHGGYSFCGLAALVVAHRSCGCLESTHPEAVDLRAFRRWLCARQMRLEGGFQGRTNKLVDGCYSFWQGSAAAVLSVAQRLRDGEAAVAVARGEVGRGEEGERGAAGAAAKGVGGGAKAKASRESCCAPFSDLVGPICTDSHALQRYILFCCQDLGQGGSGTGGLRDKPSTRPDYYHTCYCLSGLSVAQHFDVAGGIVEGSAADSAAEAAAGGGAAVQGSGGGPAYSPVVGVAENKLHPTDPVFNLRIPIVQAAAAHFAEMPCSHEELLLKEKK